MSDKDTNKYEGLVEEKVCEEEFDITILPGGLTGTTNLQNNPQVIDLIKKMYERN